MTNAHRYNDNRPTVVASPSFMCKLLGFQIPKKHAKQEENMHFLFSWALSKSVILVYFVHNGLLGNARRPQFLHENMTHVQLIKLRFALSPLVVWDCCDASVWAVRS